MSNPKRRIRDSLSRKVEKLFRSSSPALPRSTVSTNDATAAQMPSSSSNLLSPPTPGPALPASRTSMLLPAEPSAPASPPRSPDLADRPAWVQLRTTLRSLHKCAVVFLPLQSAIESVISSIDVLELALEHPDDYENLASELKSFVEFLIRYFQQSKSARMSEFIERISMAIEEQANQINDKQDHEAGTRLTEAKHEVEEFARCYRRMQGLFRQLQANAMLSWNITGEQLVNDRLEEMTPAKRASYDSQLPTDTNRQTFSKDTRMAILQELNTWSCDPCFVDDFMYSRAHERRDLGNSRRVYVFENGNTVSTFHPSFSDFIFNQARLSRFFCDEAKHNQFLARRCFELMKEQLRFNICNLESSFVRDKDVKDLDDRIKKYISPALSYACRYWSDHLQQVNLSEELLSYIGEFLSDRFLFWMEVMNLMHWMKIGTKMLRALKSWLMTRSAPSDLLVPIEDCRRFMANFMANPVSESTPHIYVSALPFCHRSSSVFEKFRKQTRGLVAARGQIIERREAAPFAIWKTGRAANSIAFSPDGTRLVFGTDEGTVTVKDVIDGRVVAGPLKGHEQWVLSVAFSPDGKSIASGSSDSTILVWNANNGMCLAGPFRGHTDAVKSVTFSPNNAHIISGSWDHSIRVWGVQDGIPILAPFLSHTKAVNSVAVSPDGTRIISGSDDHTIQIWDAYRGTRVISPLVGHSGSVTSVAFSPDGTRIISGSKDCTILIWDAFDGARVSTPLTGHSSPVQSVAFSPNSAQIVSSSDDGNVRVWSAVDGAHVGSPFEGHTKQVRSVAFSPDSTCIVSSGDDCTIHIWNTFTNNSSSPQSGHTSNILSVAFSPDGTRIVSGSADRSICIWGANDGSLVAGPMVGHTGWVRSVAISPDGTRIASGSDDHTIIIWDALDGSRIAGPLQGHTSRVTSVCFTPDGTRIVSGSWDKTLRVWSTRDYTLIGNPFKGHTNWVRSVAFSPSGAYIVSGSDDNTIIIWDAFKGTRFTDPLKGHSRLVLSVAFSPNGMWIVSGSRDNTIRIWSARSGTLIAGPFNVHTNWIQSVAYSPDGTHIVSSSNGTVVVSDASNGTVVAGPFKGHADWVRSVAFSPDGMSVVSGSDDRTIRIWDVHNITSNAHPPEHDPIPTNHQKKSFPATQITANNNGWVTNQNSDLLFWVPPEVAEYLPPLHNTLLIRPEGSIGIDYQGLFLGHDWHQCYCT